MTYLNDIEYQPSTQVSNFKPLSEDMFPADAFWSRAAKKGECWEWQDCRGSDGYGVFKSDYQAIFAHRYAYFLAYGFDPGPLMVCHHCDVESCIRPDHLFLGTSMSNLHDRARKMHLIDPSFPVPPFILQLEQKLFGAQPRAFIPRKRSSRKRIYARTHPMSGIEKRGDKFRVNIMQDCQRIIRTFDSYDEARSCRDKLDAAHWARIGLAPVASASERE